MNAKQFDQLRETPELADIDSLPRERRFQIYMSRRDVERAYGALYGLTSQLAYALWCQYYAALGKPEKVEYYLSKKEPGHPEELEAYCIFDNWNAWLLAEQGKHEEAVALYEIALYNARYNLGLPYLAKTIENNLAAEKNEYKDIKSNNKELQLARMNSNFLALLKNRSYNEIKECPLSYKNLAKATQAKDNFDFITAYNLLDNLIISDKDIAILQHLLILELAGRDSRHRPYIKPQESLTGLRALLGSRHRQPEVREAIQTASKVYPLGILLAQRYLALKLCTIPVLYPNGVFKAAKRSASS